MTTQTDDRVWFNSQRKFAGICADVMATRNDGLTTLLLAHFPVTLSILESSLRTAGVEFHTFSIADAPTLCSTAVKGKILVGLTRAFQPTRANLVAEADHRMQIIVAEHYPTYGRDKTIVDLAELSPCKPQVCFHAALDDPLMQHFGSDKIVTLFKRLGNDEAECISHSLVTAAIRNAQQKIEQQVQREMQTQSMEDWFRFNLKPTW